MLAVLTAHNTTFCNISEGASPLVSAIMAVAYTCARISVAWKL